jgi:hypothetical protein
MKKHVNSEENIALNVGTKADVTLIPEKSKERFVSQTNWKLSEAEFFLDHLKKFKVTTEDENALEKTYDFLKKLVDLTQESEYNRIARDFCYYVSAFLGAYGSMPDVMNAEYKASGFDKDWVDKIIDNDSEMMLLKLLRNVVVHQKLISMFPSVHVASIQGEEAKGDFTWFFSEDIKDLEFWGVKRIAKINGIDSIIKNQDIITICSECMKKIENCVLKCEKRFSPSSLSFVSQ